MKNTDRIVIAGAGPIGLICAHRLAGMGIPVLVVDKSTVIPTDLRASTWHPATLDMLEEIGVTSYILEKGAKAPTWQYRFRDTGERAIFDLRVLSNETRHPYRVQCEQFHIVRYLAEKLSDFDNAEIRWGTQAVDVGQDDDCAWLDVECEGERERLTGRLVIGADGGRSIIREKLGIGFEGKTYEAITMVAITDFPFEDHFEGLSGVNYIWTEYSNFSLLRVPDRWRSGITPKPGQTPEEALSDDSLEAHFQAIVPRDDRYDILARGMYSTHQMVAERFNVGRILLAGDAAHLNSPNGGLGMNTGVHDAFNLTEKISGVWQGANGLDLFDRYTRQRKAIAIEYAHKISDANHFRMRERDPAKRRVIMDEMKRITGDDTLMREWLMNSSMINSVRHAAEIT